MPTELCGIPLAHPIVNASGTFDALAAARAFGDRSCSTASPSPPS